MAPKHVFNVEWDAAKTLRHADNFRRSNKQEDCVGIDEPTNKPGTGDPVDLKLEPVWQITMAAEPPNLSGQSSNSLAG